MGLHPPTFFHTAAGACWPIWIAPSNYPMLIPPRTECGVDPVAAERQVVDPAAIGVEAEGVGPHGACSDSVGETFELTPPATPRPRSPTLED